MGVLVLINVVIEREVDLVPLERIDLTRIAKDASSAKDVKSPGRPQPPRTI